MTQRKQIVILGAGFGGLRAALQLGRKMKRHGLDATYEVLLIDRNDHHTYTPLLYEVATTSKETADLCRLYEIATYKIEPIIKDFPIRFLKAEVGSIDLKGGNIHLKSGGKLRYDYLVVALGSETNFYDVKGLKEYALPLKTFTDAIRIRDTIWNLAMSEQKEIKAVIGGGGSTGVELAAELKVWCGQLEKEFKKCKLEISIVQSTPTLLPGFHPKVIRLVGERLKNRLGVQLLTGERITKAEKGKVVLRSGSTLSYDVLVWAGGIRAPEVLATVPLKVEERGRIVALGPMECVPETPDLKLYKKIYALGDAVCCYDKSGKPLPAVARAAISQANVVAHNIIEDIKVEKGLTRGANHRIYKPMDYPYIIPIGGKFAVAKFGPVIVNGFAGWVLKGLVELNYLVSIMPLRRALRIWLKGLWTFIQNDRLG